MEGFRMSLEDLLEGGSYAYSSYETAQTVAALGIVSLVLAIVATVLAFIFITPEKKRASLPKFFQVVADVFNFKGLIIEKILKALYIFLTIYVILDGFFMIFVGAPFFSCLLTMVLGPVLVRVVFELLMMLVLLVKNVISINNKLKNQNDEPAKDDFAFDYSQFTAPEAPKAEEAAFCVNCGTKVEKGNAFCPDCGTPVNK